MKGFQYILLTVLMISFTLTVIGQKKEAQKKYKSISSRNLKLDQSVPSLLAEAEELREKDPSTALDKVEEALALSITQESSFNEASCYLMLGKINEQIEEWELALNHYRNAYNLLETDYSTTPEYEQTLMGMGRAHNELNNYDSALGYFNKKLDVANSPVSTANSLLDIADTYYESEAYDSALTNLNLSDQIIQQEQLTNLQLRSNAIRSKIVAQEDVDSAEYLYQQTQIIQQSQDAIGNTEGVSFNYSTNDDQYLEESKEELISAFEKQNRVEDEIQLRNQSIAENTERGRPKKVTEEKIALGEKFIAIGETSAAIRELEDAALIADSIGSSEDQARAYQTLAETYYQEGQTSKSLEAYRKFGEALKVAEEEERARQAQKATILKKQQGIVDLSKDLALDESEYQLQLTTSSLRRNQLQLQRLAIYGLMFLLFGAMLAVVFINRSANRSKKMSQLLALKSLRSQMNPHFIFNALNSVNTYISKNDERSANKFIADFSKLMRLVLDNSQKDFITLAEEKQTLELYLKLEHSRFRDKFDYHFEIDEDIALDTVEIPPMLIQPYIENAIWHGLRYKEEKGLLDVKILSNDSQLVVEIVDDGIGRSNSMALKTENQKKHNSSGIKNSAARVNIINKVYQKNYNINVSDLNDDKTGTKVQIILPINGVKHG